MVSTLYKPVFTDVYLFRILFYLLNDVNLHDEDCDLLWKFLRVKKRRRQSHFT